MRQWRRALAERQHVERGRRMERLLKTLTVRENQSRGHVVAEATTESPLQPTPEPLPRSEADCPDSPKQHTPPTPLPQPRRPTLAVNGGGCGGAVRLGESALLDASGRPARRGGRCEARRGDSGEAVPPGTESEGEADEAGAEGAASTCRAASAMLGLSWRANSSRAPPRPASLSPAATAAVPRTAAATVDADADDACATRGACSLASAFEAAATERPERPAGASADHDGSALELGLVALRRLINATPSGGRSSSGGRDNLASRVLEPESERQATSSASPSSPPPSSPPPSCPPTAIRQPHDRGHVPAETPPQQGGAPRPRDCESAAATATAAAAEVAAEVAGAGEGAGADTGRDAAAGRRGDGALLAIRLQVRAAEETRWCTMRRQK